MLTAPIYSDAHPEHNDDDDIDLTAGKPELETPSKDVPAASDSTIPAEAMIAQAYVSKAVFFFLIVAAVLYVVRRRRTSALSDDKVDEKSMA